MQQAISSLEYAVLMKRACAEDQLYETPAMVVETMPSWINRSGLLAPFIILSFLQHQSGQEKVVPSVGKPTSGTTIRSYKAADYFTSIRASSATTSA
jgi:hypothetical protein